uniref:Transposable element Tcb1 transposase n=1 Tax=Anoplophora glabripennis TaxID=217634 RepID=V5I9M2_ANOGL
MNRNQQKNYREDQDRALVAYLRENPFTDMRHAIEATGFPGCKNTATVRLKEQGLFNYTAPSKELLTVQHRERRLQFARNYIQQGQHFWNNVIFSDEKIFQSTNSGKVKVYRPKNQRFHPRYVCERARSGRFSVPTWAWISDAGPGVIWRVEGNLTGLQYRTILSDIMVPSVSVFHREFIFQHDNSPVHTSAVVRAFMEQNNINVLPWPAKSPDLNPNENLWASVMRQLNEQ